MRTSRTARRLLVVAAAAIAVVGTVIAVGPLTLVEYGEQGTRALVERYGTAWIAAAGVVVLATILVRRSQPRRPEPARAESRAQATRADGRPQLTVVRPEVRS